MTVFLFFGCYISPFHTPQKCWSFSSGKSHGKSPWVCWGKPQHFRPEAPPSSTSIWTWPQVSGWGCPGPGVSTMKGSPGFPGPGNLQLQVGIFCWAKIWDPLFWEKNLGESWWSLVRIWSVSMDIRIWQLAVKSSGKLWRVKRGTICRFKSQWVVLPNGKTSSPNHPQNRKAAKVIQVVKAQRLLRKIISGRSTIASVIASGWQVRQITKPNRLGCQDAKVSSQSAGMHVIFQERRDPLNAQKIGKS